MIIFSMTGTHRVRPIGSHGFDTDTSEKALSNARQDVGLTPMEEDIIIHHMFPLTRKPPKSREAKIVCLVDKGCGLYDRPWAAAPIRASAV